MRTKSLQPRTATADKVVQSVCPYCAVGCGQRVFVKDERVVQIANAELHEGQPVEAVAAKAPPAPSPSAKP